MRRVAGHIHRVPGLLPFPGTDLLTLTTTAAASIQYRPERAHETTSANATDGPFSCVPGGRAVGCRVPFFEVANRLENGPGSDSAPAMIYESARHMTSPSASSSYRCRDLFFVFSPPRMKHIAVASLLQTVSIWCPNSMHNGYCTAMCIGAGGLRKKGPAAGGPSCFVEGLATRAIPKLRL